MARRKQHGGRRKGAGRKPTGGRRKVPVTVRLPQHIVSWLREQDESQAVLIERALAQYVMTDDTTDTTREGCNMGIPYI